MSLMPVDSLAHLIVIPLLLCHLMGNFSRKVVILYLGNKMEDVKTGREKIFSLFLLGGENGNEILQNEEIPIWDSF